MFKRLNIALLILLGFTAAVFAQGIAIDPAEYTPSARVLGMGRAYVGLADDVSAIYLNPAGIANSKTWKIGSMSGKFVSDYDYLSATGIYPVNVGVVGVGFDTYSIGGALATTIDATSDPNDPIYIVDPSQPSISNYNSVLILSYAVKGEQIPIKSNLLNNLSVGANLRLYSVGLAGDHITEGSANGFEADFGAMYSLYPQLSLGASVQNVLPASMGGKLTYIGGHTETYPASAKIGAALKIVGQEDSLMAFQEQQVVYLLDFDIKPTTTGWPIVYHTGLEWTPVPLFSLRAGIDQTALGDGLGTYLIFNDLTLGAGMNYNGFKFDYAYRQFNAIPGADNHSFSLSFSPAVKGKKASSKLIDIEKPLDKTLTFKNEEEVKGKITDLSKAKNLQIDKQPVLMSPLGEFSLNVKMKELKNKIEVTALDRFKTPIVEEKLRLLKLAAFPDVPEGYWARQQVSLVSMLNIVTGYPDGTFRPEGNITRAEMAALLMRSNAGRVTSNELNPVTRNSSLVSTFRDVKSSHWASGFIADAAATGVVEGYPDKTFRPKGNITRAEGLAMIARFAKVTQEAYSFQFFPDVSASYWASPIIAGSSKAGMLEFLKGRAFEPKRNMTRAEAVEVLYRTQFVKNLLDKDLLNWEGY